jgi:hypothetical protein
MVILAAIISALLLPVSVAQASVQTQTPPPSTITASPVADDAIPALNNGPCLDSPRAVPHVLQEPVVREMQIMRIDKVISTYSMTPDEIIGFIYVTHDGTDWLGQRTSDYMSAVNAREINKVLASTRLSPMEPSSFPPTMRLGVPIRSEQFFRVQIPQAAWRPLHIRIETCVAWPEGRSLPDPSF